MRLISRRFLLIGSFTVFIVIAPIMILYAIGYRPITTTLPQAVGVLLVRATPPKASVSVNGTAYGTLPRSVPNLIPGTINVKITKDGYQDWEKNLEIKPMQATEARNVQLIPTTPDQDPVAQAISTFAVSPDNSTIALVHTDGTLSLTDTNGKISTTAVPLNESITTISWSPDSTYILLSSKSNKHTLIHFINQAIQKIPVTTTLPAQSLQWDPSQSHVLIGITALHELVQYRIETQAVDHVADSVQAFSFFNNQPIYQRIDNSIAQQDKTYVDTNKHVTKMLPSPHGEIALLFEGGEVSLLDKNGSLRTIASSALSVTWSPDGLMLLLQTAQDELNIYNVSNDRFRIIPKNELHLLTRLSKPITNPQWHTDSQHVFYQADGILFFTEIDSRDHAITQTVTTSPSSLITISKDTESILGVMKNTLTRTWLVTKDDR